jgi:Cu-processing system permease protein
MKRIIRFIILDILRNRIVLVYTLILAAFSWSIFGLEDTYSKGLLSLLNIILLIVPMVSILFSTIYIYNSSEFIELLLSQPVHRSRIWWSLFLGLSGSLAIAFLIGAGIPLLVYTPIAMGGMMIIVGSLISVIFVSLAFLSSILSRDKAKGIGVSIMIWLFFALLFDGLVLFLLFQLSDYPIERLMVGITALNPIDLGRILILLKLDISAMMGYTGAVFKKFFGSQWGTILSIILLGIWALVPYLSSLAIFKKRDL